MSKSLQRVVAALRAAGESVVPVEMAAETRTAVQAAEAAGCSLDQIVKSILFQGQVSGGMFLFLTRGGQQVGAGKASALAGEPLGRADANVVRAVTGFAIGGVSPIGHLTPSQVWFDAGLLDFPVVWAAAGTPRHIFAMAPARLSEISGAVVEQFVAEQATEAPEQQV